MISDYLKAKGFKCKGTTTGMKGLEAIKKNEPKLILLDILLPDINGFDLCKEIKSNESTKNIPIFYITAIPLEKVEEMMEETQADGFILKPFNFSDFEQVIGLL